MSAPIRVADVSPYSPPRCPDCGLMMRHAPRRRWWCRTCGPYVERPEPAPVDLDALVDELAEVAS